MNLARHSISATKPLLLFDARFDADCQIFTAATSAGFAIYSAWPMKLLRHREVTGGTLSAIVPLHCSSLLFLLGGGRSPRYPPNKVILWDDAIGAEVAELEFRERVRGLACRRGWLAVALRRRVVLFEIGETVTRFGEWETCDNTKGLLAIATGAYATLLVIPGRQLGHVQLIHLPPCPPPPPLDPPNSDLPMRPPPPPTKTPIAIVVAHTSALSTITVPPSGRLLATTSQKGTLIRIWDCITGKRIRELRRGTDQAEIYGVAFRPDEQELCVWSDKGTVHAFSLTLTGSGSSNRQSTFSPLAPFISLPKYFDSEWSYAQYRIPTRSSHISISTPAPRAPTDDVSDEERCVVGWIQVPNSKEHTSGTTLPPKYELIVLTYTGGWYRLSLPGNNSSRVDPPKRSSRDFSPRARTSSGSSTTTGKSDKGKDRARDSDAKSTHECTLQEYRTFGRWDGWG